MKKAKLEYCSLTIIVKREDLKRVLIVSVTGYYEFILLLFKAGLCETICTVKDQITCRVGHCCVE